MSLERQQKGSGYVAHPAVTDNCMQLGPMTGALEAAGSSAAAGGTTRVVAGLAAFLARYNESNFKPILQKLPERSGSEASGCMARAPELWHCLSDKRVSLLRVCGCTSEVGIT